MAGDALGPWWVGIGAGIVSTLGAVIAKLWAALTAERAARAAEVEQIRYELAEANRQLVELQQAATNRGDEHQQRHLRDLRRLTGLSTSVEPPRPDPWPPVIVRAAPVRAKPPPRKPG